jgi:hypothetical protein
MVSPPVEKVEVAEVEVTVRVPPVLMFAPMVVVAKTEAAEAKRRPERRERRRGERGDFTEV